MQSHVEQFGMEAALRGLKARGYRPAVVYDVGAADGKWTELALQHWADATYVCFEPLSERRGALAALERRHPGRLIVQACGVGDEDTELSLGVTDTLYDSSFAYSGSSSRTVPVRRLDTLLSRGIIPPPSFMKLDVQGFEKRVLDGGAAALRTAELVVMECQFFPFCEDMRTLDATIGHMSALGFVPYEFVDFLRRPLDGAMGQCDILFARRGHRLLADTRWSR
ncbi:MAG TPA: FkbM family methyltransferase [Anaeromyxobacter sp.]